jgi:hypothetical protein
MKQTAIYVRLGEADAWKFERVTTPEAATLAAETNKGFSVSTLLFTFTDKWQGLLPTWIAAEQIENEHVQIISAR